MVEEGGFEPPKRDATDLQSAPFGHSGTPPYVAACISHQAVNFIYYNTADVLCQVFLTKNVELVAGLEPVTC